MATKIVLYNEKPPPAKVCSCVGYRDEAIDTKPWTGCCGRREKYGCKESRKGDQCVGCGETYNLADLEYLEDDPLCRECYEDAMADIAETAERKAGWDPNP